MKSLTIAACIFALTLTAFAETHAQLELEVYGRYTVGSEVEPSFCLMADAEVSEQVDLTYLAITEEEWAESLFGFKYSPARWVTLGLSTGLEYAPTGLRSRGSAWFGKGRNSLSLWGEMGEDKESHQYRVALAYRTSECLTVEAAAWRFHGIGPVVRYTPKKSDLTIWVMPAHDPEFRETRIILGLCIRL